MGWVSAFRALLVGVAPLDLVTYAGILVTLGVLSRLACDVPARRASSISLGSREIAKKRPALSLYVYATAEDIERVGLKYD